MTKIKDLVTVLVDNAFLLFPVDTERYELRGHACAYLLRLHGLREKHPSDQDERVKSFLDETDKTIVRCSFAFARDFSTDSSRTKADDHRARLVMASFDRLDLQDCWDQVDFADAAAVRNALWWLFIVAIQDRRSIGQQIVPKDKGAST